ncbi:Arabinogalactan protein 14, partial [Cucurbita argyrosperma subsp. sororia]
MCIINRLFFPLSKPTPTPTPTVLLQFNSSPKPGGKGLQISQHIIHSAMEAMKLKLFLVLLVLVAFAGTMAQAAAPSEAPAPAPASDAPLIYSSFFASLSGLVFAYFL